MSPPAPAVTVLMYHALVEASAAGNGAVHIKIGLFAQHMAWLHAQGYEAITVTELYRRLTAGQLTANSVVITFDDGYLSLLKYAAPTLAKYNLAATLFVTTDFVGRPDYSTAEFAQSVPQRDRPLTWAEIKVLRDAGWDIQAHSCTHRPHAALTIAQLKHELTSSKQLIGSQLEINPRFYAYPYGSYNRLTLRSLVATGYAAGFSVHSGQVGAASDLRRLPRAEINTGCGPAVFAQLVRTGYPSGKQRRRARLRDIIFRYPIIKDAIQALFTKAIN